MTVILASSSIFRRQLLSKLRISFKSISPDVDESRFRGESVRSYVKRLSIDKANKVASFNSGSIVIGSDEVADLNGMILGKPLTRSNAMKQLKMISGNKVIFRTGLCVMDSDSKKYYSSVNNYTINFKHLDDKLIKSYLNMDDVLKCAASIRIEGAAINLVKSMRGSDPSSIMGLPLLKLIEYLDKFGVKVLTK